MVRKLKAISLFSGAGGMDICFNAAGFEILASIELDPACCDTLRENLRNSKTVVIEEDIRNINGAFLCDKLGLKVGELDCLFGGPPCQSFSLAGARKGLKDDRGQLLVEFFRLVDELRPKVFVIENVKGILNWSSGEVLKFFDSFFDTKNPSALPYSVQHKCLDAVDFGVPQFRERAFFVGNRLEKQMIFPEPKRRNSLKANATGSLEHWNTVGNAILDLPAATPPSAMASRVSQTIKGRIERHGY
jgi:DNA (cytosine-5)-methyltransferase 1